MGRYRYRESYSSIMNVEIEAGSLTIGFVAEIVQPKVVIELEFEGNVAITYSVTTCFYPTILQVNGHSLSSVNPDFALIGVMATLAMA